MLTGNASAFNDASPPPAAGYGKSLALLATLFFMWGFITVINNTLLPHLRSVFELADRFGLQNSYWLTVACELYILFYALWGSKPIDALAP